MATPLETVAPPISGAAVVRRWPRRLLVGTAIVLALTLCASAVLAAFGGAYRLTEQRAACAQWARGVVSASHRQAIKSDIPSLLLSGEHDPVTPPSGGDEVARGLPKGRHLVIRNNGHPIGTAESCIGRMVGQFLDTGSAAAVDARCAAENPASRFVVSGKNQ